jgi:hypothetical protein
MPLAAQGVDHFGKPSTLCIACRHGTRHQRTKRISHGTSPTRQRPRAAFRSTPKLTRREQAGANDLQLQHKLNSPACSRSG